MALLVYSDKCHHCQEILKYVQGQSALQPILRFWNVTTQGVPSQKIKRVPTLVTNEGKMMVGSEVKSWLESMVPVQFESFDSIDYAFNLDGTEINNNLFETANYGASLQPIITPDLEEKINSSVSTAYQKRSGV